MGGDGGGGETAVTAFFPHCISRSVCYGCYNPVEF